MKDRIPQEVRDILIKLEQAGFASYVVGGCVRDLLLGREPEDWDVATQAAPEEVQKLFPDSFYENKFFTVTVLTKSKEEKLKEIEVTTFRADFAYGDRRRPGKVEYAKTIEEDLARRDFTINAIALRVEGSAITEIDPFSGKQDLKQKLIRAVGNPAERFQEDALRLLRAVRFAASLEFSLEQETEKALREQSLLLKEISQERIRDEFLKIIMSPRAVQGIEQLRTMGLLQHMLSELEEGYGVGQNKHHVFTVWEHNIKSLEYAVSQNWGRDVRVASLLHDVGKPRVKAGEGKDSTFYGHEIMGATMTRTILTRLKFPKKDVEKIAKLVRYHLFYYNVDEVTESSVRRLVRNVGKELVEELLEVRMADRIGSGVPKAEPYKLRHLRYLIEKVQKDPISSSMLAISGTDVMRLGNLEPSSKVGQILDVLLGEVLEDPKNNTRETLTKRTNELLSLSEKSLSALSAKAKQAREQVETKRDEMTKQKYWIS